jgi:GntR family transcriptional regulator, transcriptional repressor for pyruvate dehydrogenase complex
MDAERKLSTDEALAAGARHTLAGHPARRRSLPGEIVDQLLGLIATDAALDTRLPPERTLSEQLGVSRASLREALSALGELGVIETRGKVKYVRPSRAKAVMLSRAAGPRPERELVTDPLEVRRMLEPEVSARAAERVTAAGLRELESWLRLMEESAEQGELAIEYDSAFHVAIARTTENQTLVHLITALTDALRDSRELSFQPSESIATALEDHRAILNGIAARNPAAAREAMRKHLDHVETLIRASLRGHAVEDQSSSS